MYDDTKTRRFLVKEINDVCSEIHALDCRSTWAYVDAGFLEGLDLNGLRRFLELVSDARVRLWLR